MGVSKSQKWKSSAVGADTCIGAGELDLIET